MVALRTTEGHVDGHEFLVFSGNDLIPEMEPFDGNLRSRSVVVMDNASIHRTQDILDLFHHAGILRVFQPAYSLDFNVWELVFAHVKRLLKNYHDLELEDYPQEIFLHVLRDAFYSVTPELLQKFAVHCGYE